MVLYVKVTRKLKTISWGRHTLNLPVSVYVGFSIVFNNQCHLYSQLVFFYPLHTIFHRDKHFALNRTLLLQIIIF